MKKLFLSAIIALMAITLGLYAQEKEKTQTEPKVTLELIYQKNFDEIIGPKGFPPPEITQILKDKDIPQEDKDWLLNSLRIEIARREKVLYANDGKAVTLPDDLQAITTSKNLKYMIVYAAHTDYGGLTAEEVKELKDEWLKSFKNYDQWRAKYEKATTHSKEAYKDSMYYWLEIRDNLERRLSNIQKYKKEYKRFICVETKSGMILWENSDIPKVPYISNDGKAVVATLGGGEYGHIVTSVFFYDENGQFIKEVDNLYCSSGCAGLSADGERFYIMTRKNPKETSPTAVASFNVNGSELWRQEVPGNWIVTIPCFDVADNHKYTVVSLNSTTLIDEDANIIATYNCRTYNPKFSPDGQYLVLPGDDGDLYFIQSANGDILWQKPALSRHSYCYIAPDGKFIIEKTSRIIRLYNKDGNVLTESTLFDEDPSIVIKEVTLSPTGIYSFVESNVEMLLYRVRGDK
jgi:outer membrane protein assembly factor BamB